ncbi:hypothetical protein [Caulifigura coniformis]|nr:hypothetical protein [Caulifigura coniformis]
MKAVLDNVSSLQNENKRLRAQVARLKRQAGSERYGDYAFTDACALLRAIKCSEGDVLEQVVQIAPGGQLPPAITGLDIFSYYGRQMLIDAGSFEPDKNFAVWHYIVGPLGECLALHGFADIALKSGHKDTIKLTAEGRRFLAKLELQGPSGSPG